MKAIAALLALVIAFVVGGWSIEYMVEFWSPFIVGHAVDVPFIPCAVAGLFLSQFSMPLALLTWVISFII